MQRLLAILTCLMTTLAVAPISATAQAPPVRWLRNLDEARDVAQRAKKDLLILFTGLDWCGSCSDMERQVFSQPAFLVASEHFVLVELDYPGDRELLGNELRPLYDAWQKQYLIRLFPTVVLADPDGAAYAYLAGCEESETAQSFLERLRVAQATRVARDREFLAAAAVDGVERARALFRGLEAVAERLGSMADNGDDPLLVMYANTIENIRQLDRENAAGVRAIYDARIEARDNWRKREAVLEALKQFGATPEESVKAVAFIDRELPAISDDDLRWRLERARHVYLEWGHRNEEALANARRLQKDPKAVGDQLEWLLDREAFNLFNLGRLDDGIAHYDRRIAAATDNKQRLSLMEWKAQMLHNRGTPKSVTAWQDVRNASEPESELWKQSTFLLAMTFELLEDRSQTIQLLGELSQHGPSPAYRLRIAENQRRLGLMDDARRTLDRVELEMPADSDRPSEQRDIDDLREQLARLRKLLEANQSTP